MSSIESIQKENAELRKIIESHADEIERCKSVIYQLVGGLFNQKTQKWIGKAHANVLLGKKYEPEENEEDEVCCIWPTTRQGDEHEERIRKMEETMRKLEDRIVSFEKKMLL
jgi:hypothetical protein